MARLTIRRWIKKDLAARQQAIRDFYVTGDRQLHNSFLSLVRAPKGYGIFGSIGPRIQFAVYGRDSIEVAEDLLETNPELAREVIILLAELQGVATDPKSEEEPGKIHHEFRRPYFHGHRIPRSARRVYDELRGRWGRPDKPLLYYGSFDATPLYVRLVHRYIKLHGRTILAHKVRGKDGMVRPIRDHVRFAAEWMAGKVVSSPWHLFESRPLNPLGIPNQEWEDSAESYVHPDGVFANYKGGVASVELQGYTYDALLAAAELAATDDAEASTWRDMAKRIQTQTLEMLWMPKARYFALGLDRHPRTGQTRRITTLNANGALLLDSHLLSDLPHDQAKPYIDGIVAMIGGADFMTAAGPRIRSLAYISAVKYADYHGSLVTWPKETYDIAKGLHRAGHHALATRMEDAILDAVAQSGEFYEFYLVSRDGRVKYHYRREDPDEPAVKDFNPTVVPEAGQAWTISAVLAIVHQRKS